MKIVEVLYFYRNPRRRSLQICAKAVPNAVNFNYFGVAFTIYKNHKKGRTPE